MAGKKRKSNARANPRISTPTPMQVAMLAKVIATGNHFSTACKAAGVSWDQFQGWLENGRKGRPELAKFIEAIDKAEAASEVLGCELVMEAAQKGLKRTRTETRPNEHGELQTIEVEEYVPDWRAAAWLLEHRFGERFAALRKLQHGGGLTHRQVVVLHEGDPSLERDDWDAIGERQQENHGTEADAEAEAGGPGGAPDA